MLEQTRELLPPRKQATWEDELKELLERREESAAPPDAGNAGAIWTYVLTYLTMRGAATAKDEVLLGRPYHDVEKGRVLFLADHLQNYLRQRRVYVDQQKLWRIVRERGGTHDNPKIKGKNVYLWTVPLALVEEATVKEDFDVPRVPLPHEETD